MRRALRRGFAVLLVLVVIVGAGLGWSYHRHVVVDPGPGFTRAAVMAIIDQESPVYYRDGVTPLGAFFDQEHRRYVPYAELPEAWVHAIVAAEDGNFWAHPGVDPKHIARAIVQNVRAGKLVAGGSTLTQQTAKNLFYRPDRSLRSKWIELGNALRLEAHFSKEDILEFYANQFHVSANGRGLGIAARYFFDKEPAELTVKECAYIAGMVKGPANYNPFIGESEERRARARTAAEDRTAYVLRRMMEEGFLDEREHERLRAEPLVFRRGTFQYDRSVLLDEVQRELEEPAFIELFERLGIDNPSTAGIQIVTTLDAAAQREATWALWHHISELGASLEGGGALALRSARTTMVMAPGVPLSAHEVAVARVAWVGESLALDLGGRPCALDAAAEDRARLLVGGKGPLRPLLAEALPDGTYVLASVREVGPAGAVCDLERRPALQGAALVLEDGQIRAMVGGNDNRNFNRAVAAQRQFGSTWKPLVYASAVHLGWLPTDILDNRRGVFPFRDVWYYPQPDHASEAWMPLTVVGARSENLASVWLLHHLTDRLNPEQLRRLAELVGLSRRPDETPEAWLVRLRDEEALRSSPDRFEEYAFTLARQDVASGLAFSTHPEDALALRSLHHGRGFSAERARVLATAASPARTLKLRALDATLIGLEELVTRCLAGDAEVTWSLHGAYGCGAPPPGAVPLVGGWAAVGSFPPDHPAALLPHAPSSPLGLPGMAPPASLALPMGLATPVVLPDPAAIAEAWLSRVAIDGQVHLSTLRELRAATDRRAAELAGRDPWDADVLALNPDFRVLVGIRYLTGLVRSFGVEGELPEGLTLPLGAADVSLLDAATLYQGMLHGERVGFTGRGFEEGGVVGLRATFDLPPSPDPVALIAEIRDAEGNVLYRAEPTPTRVTDPVAGELVGDVLRNVVRIGTGRRAASAVSLGGVAVPLAGKTGTTNDYRNAAFLGVVPKIQDGAARWGEGYTVAVYVGYDDNRSMRRGATRVQGASGALPAWLGIARGLAAAGLLGAGGASEYTPSPGLVRVEVAPGVDGAPGPTALVPEGYRRMFAPYTEPPTEAAGGPSPAPPPAEPLVLPAFEGEPSVWDGI